MKSSDPARPSRSSKWFCAALIAPMSLAVQIPVDSTEVADSTVVTHDMNVLVSPLPDSVDTSYERVTKFTMGGGGGRYYREVLFPIMTECGPGQYSVPFKEDYVDVGAELDFQANRVAHVGMRGGYIATEADVVGAIDTVTADELPDDHQDTFYFNPYFSFEWKWIGLGAGGLVSTHPLHTGSSEDFPVETGAELYPTAHLRIGSLSSIYASAHLWEGVPVYSGGGTFMGGVGVRPVAPIELYGAYCAPGPYQEEQWLGRLTVDLGRSWSILTTVRFPTDYQSVDYSESEYGIGVGISYRKYTPTPGN